MSYLLIAYKPGSWAYYNERRHEYASNFILDDLLSRDSLVEKISKIFERDEFLSEGEEPHEIHVFLNGERFIHAGNYLSDIFNEDAKGVIEKARKMVAERNREARERHKREVEDRKRKIAEKEKSERRAQYEKLRGEFEPELEAAFRQSSKVLDLALALGELSPEKIRATIDDYRKRHPYQA